jgi:phosphoglycerate dehydrogenase-like enzyme
MTQERAAAKGATSVSFDELVATSHIVTAHLVLGPTTRNLFGASQFAAMRRDAIFVNTSRAGLADEVALAAALKAGRPAMAALDVFSEEPVPTTHPLVGLPNVVLTPHLGFVCEPVFRKFYGDVVEALTAWLYGKPLPRVLAA